MTRIWPSIVAHADMDAFYAAVEQLDRPELRGKPLLVGPPSRRGVVLTASYEARPFRVGSAMPMAEARRRCPEAVVVPPRFERYQAVSKRVMQVFREFSPRVEPLSLDEAFIDMTGAEGVFGTPHEMGAAIKRAILDATGLTVSVGLSGTKYVAKVASAYLKPDGLTVVPPDEAQAWLAPLPVSRLWGAGPKMQQRLLDSGLATIGDVAAADPGTLARELGSAGTAFHALAHGRDPRPVESARRSKSLGSERTLAEDVSELRDIAHHLRSAADVVARRLRANGYRAGGVRVKLKRSDFRLLSRQRSLPEPSAQTAHVYRAALELLEEFDDPGPFRLVGVAAYDLVRAADVAQLDLLDERERKSSQLDSVLDALDERFGRGTVQRAANLVRPGGIGPEVNLDFLEDPDD